MTLLLGCIADDFTGATDLANILTRNGMRTVQTIGIPVKAVPDAEAIVIALKSRTIPAKNAVAETVEACRWLKSRGAQQIFFKYCSTFDSTDKGNIGPVADALLEALQADFTIACPAFPENKRSVYLGHLFVGDVLLSDSSMRHHPLTPMTDSNLVRVLGRQTKHRVGLVPFARVEKGPAAIAECFAMLRKDGVRHVIVDAVTDKDLLNIGAACKDLPLVTGGSGVALGLPENFRKAGLLLRRDHAPPTVEVGGRAAVLAGSCSAATLGQVIAFAQNYPALALDPVTLSQDASSAVAKALHWANEKGSNGPVLIYATATPEDVSRTQALLGRDAAGHLIEQAMASLAKGLVELGVRRLVVAGGETSGAVVSALGVEALEIGQQIAPGVPATLSIGPNQLALALKSGNFGGPDFFHEALQVLR
jgi:3-dehydrotetronate 4-kinase